jgi:hypothetical protein
MRFLVFDRVIVATDLSPAFLRSWLMASVSALGWLAWIWAYNPVVDRLALRWFGRRDTRHRVASRTPIRSNLRQQTL